RRRRERRRRRGDAPAGRPRPGGRRARRERGGRAGLRGRRARGGGDDHRLRGRLPAASQVVRTALQTLSLDQAQLTALTGFGVPEGEAAAALAAADASVAPVELDVVDVEE